MIKNYTLTSKEELEMFYSNDIWMLHAIRSGRDVNIEISISEKVAKIIVLIDNDGKYPVWIDSREDKYLNTLQSILEIVKLRFANELDEIAAEKANGNLSTLINLREIYGNKELSMLDNFFDNKDIRIKYGAWNEEENEPNFDITNSDIQMKLDSDDLIRLIDSYELELDIQKGNY